ncbi:MAG: hypothetical protein M3117_00435, partial [Actinomycetota bacterium]|nr:hypothetical protein [Actinomycetota bacterium]
DYVLCEALPNLLLEAFEPLGYAHGASSLRCYGSLLSWYPILACDTPDTDTRHEKSFSAA